MRNRLERQTCRRLADELGLPVTEVSKVINSFFGCIVSAAGSLPFDNERKIYTKDGFSAFPRVWNIPSLGRLGPVYSRYLKWRANESKNIEQELRSNYRARVSRSEIEAMAEEILSGRTPSFKKQEKKDNYTRIWLVGADGKRLARQVIPNKES